MAVIVLWTLVVIASTAIIWKGSGILETSSERLAAHYELPELSTTVISALVHGEFKLGVAAVVGSALFNILVIPALSGMSSREQLRLNRDLVYKEARFYMIGVDRRRDLWCRGPGAEPATASGHLIFGYQKHDPGWEAS